MEQLYILSDRLVAGVNLSYERYLSKLVAWDDHLIAIRGSRGVGKTTLMLQQIHKNNWSSKYALYTSLDHLWFTTHSIIELAEYHYTHGGKYLFLDEVHRYPNWIKELKNIADFYPQMYVTFTGSSLLMIDNTIADLSRRCVSYTMQGLSFREYLMFAGVTTIEPIGLEDILQSHTTISVAINSEKHVLPFFTQYLQNGYYPFYWSSSESTYQLRLQQVIATIIDVDIPGAESIEYSSLYKVKRLLAVLANTAPYTLNISDLCKTVGITRNQLLRLLNLLERSQLIRKLYPENTGIQSVGKPEKILFDNTNLMYALSSNVESGTMRETFFCNQLSYKHIITMPTKGDVVVDEKYLFEVGGHTKGYKQIRNTEASFIVADNIETGFGNKIPLWIFGMMY